MENKFTTTINNVLVIGSGGAGLRSAIEVKLRGLSVQVLSKRSKIDAHTALAAGGINAAFGNVDQEDSWQQHFADTFLEGYGLGDPRSIEIMAQESMDLVNELEDWGADFAKLNNGNFDQRFFGAHTYRRTCFSGDYTGRTILNTLLNKANSLNIPIVDSQYVTELLVSDGTCFGAISFNMNSAEKSIHLADAVVIATGGHTGIWKRSSSRKKENTGDGLYLALKAGCKLVDMEMVQFHPTGILKPDEIAGTLVTEAVRGEGGKLLNSNNERFMINYDKERMELSTRDRVTIANYLEIKAGRNSPNGGVFLDITHRNKEDIIKRIPRIYRLFLNEQFIDISETPMEVAPTSHYSMGGIDVEPTTHSTCINGIYAVGEVAGGLHGANRLGGNSLAEILVFGKRAGKAASLYSQNKEYVSRPNHIIQEATKNIDKLMKSGKYYSSVLQHELGEIMWEYCGVVREDNSLQVALEKIEELKEKAKYLDVRLDGEGCSDLISTYDLLASMMSAEATVLGALSRKESRGAHQRTDFPTSKNSENVNYKILLTDDYKLIVQSKKLRKLKDSLQVIVNKTKPLSTSSGMLLE
ncbi:FAD-dependent oxidoreductase [Prochlorococcus sp. MIT 1223]|uniref:FAD-dependent oxidoreductase n=1 Tax=Prochlorococcus sp. MIT 1223 TaxID=3096217 RepID=UPI002A74D419|nr:FAD-dependent oxidoreductase [Prochlorococcus sp. MIT 1223]